MIDDQIVVVDNLVSSDFASHVEQSVMGEGFPWFFHAGTVGGAYPNDGATMDGPQLVNFIRDGSVAPHIHAAILTLMHILTEKQGLKLGAAFRIKANLNTPNPSMGDAHYPAHVDAASRTPFITCIYYVNDCDGDTIFFDKTMQEIKRVTPKKGSLVYFNGNILHAGCPPKTANMRCVINMNFNCQQWLGESND